MGKIRYPGEVYHLPPDDLPGGDPKGRPHLLLTTCKEGDDSATLAFCSTQGFEAAKGAAYSLVDPFASHYRLTGLSQPTFVYPSRLVPLVGDALMEYTLAGRVIDEMPDIRIKTSEALGIGTGGNLGTAAGRGSLRGILIEFTSDVQGKIGSRHGIVVTEPAYSFQHRHLNVIPFFDQDEYEPCAGDLEMTSDSWERRLGWKRGIVALGCMTNVFMPHHVQRVLDIGLDDSSLRELDEALKERFGLR